MLPLVCRRRPVKGRCLWAAAHLLWVGTALAARPASAEPARPLALEGLSTWLEGDLGGAAVTQDGLVVLPAATRDIWQDAAAQVTAAAAFGEEVVVALAEGGRVIAIDRAGAVRPVCTLAAGAVTALVARGDTLWAATLAPAKIWRLRPAADGTFAAEELAAPSSKFVWALAAGPGDALVAALGEPGGLLRIDAAGRAHDLPAPPEAHVRSLAFHPRRGLFIGGGERGALYHLPLVGGALASRPPRALFDSGQAEVVALAVDEQATYVAAVSGAAQALRAGGEGPAPEVRAQVVRVDDDGRVTFLAGSTDEVVGALGWEGGRLLVATGTVGRPSPSGRLYAIDPATRAIALLLESPSRRLSHLVDDGAGGAFAIAAGGARLTHLAAKLARRGHFLAAPVDTGWVSWLGAIEALGIWPAGTSATLSARTGHTRQPDTSWSAWSPPQPAAAARAPAVPPGRFVQLRLDLRGDGRATPEVRQLRLSVRRQNIAPFVREVLVLRRHVALWPLPREDQKGRLVTFGERPAAPAEDGREEVRQGASGPPRARQVPERGAQAVRWSAEDQNGDDLRFSLAVRRLEEDAWHSLADDLVEPFFTLRTGSLADGRYIFRVRACDSPANPPELALCAHRDSPAVVVDGTPPVFAPLTVSTRPGGARVRGQVEDDASGLTELTFAVDYGPPRPLLPDDGVLDGPRETFRLELSGLAPGHHVVTFRAVDGQDNEAVAHASFTVPAGRR